MPAPATHRPGAAGALLREAAAVGVLTTLYPLGLLPGGVEAFVRPPARTRTHPTPILLVHGWGANRSGWMLAGHALAERGWTVRARNYNPFRYGVADLGAQVAEHARALAETSPTGRVHLVGHSLGGVLVRYAVCELGLGDIVDTTVTILAPHHGAPSAGLLRGRDLLGLGRAAADLRHGSPLLDELNAIPLDERVRWVAYHSPCDVVVPAWSAYLDDPCVRNVAVHPFGHIATLLAGGLVQSLDEELSATEGGDSGRPAQYGRYGAGGGLDVPLAGRDGCPGEAEL